MWLYHQTIKDMPYYNLRAVFQALHAGLPGHGLRVEHVRSHAGDPFNELVDWLAKREPHKSQYLPRQAVNMQTFQSILRHLWITTAKTSDVPSLTSEGYAVPPIELPPNQPSPTPQRLRTSKTLLFNISFGTANVRTFYRGDEGHPGKLQYVREQFQAHGLHFLGLQETRCEQGTSFQNQIYRIVSGHEGGHLGVELWVSLDQPYAHRGRVSRHFKRSDFVVVSQSPRHLLVHVQNEDLDFWLLSAHAPHGGTPQDCRETWWHHLSQLVHDHVQQGDLLTMIDANARSGFNDKIHVFEKDDITNANTGLFREFLAEHNICVPLQHLHYMKENTQHGFIQVKTVNIGSTTSSSPHHGMLPVPSHVASIIWTLGMGDHRAMAVELQWHGTTAFTSEPRSRVKYARTKISTTSLEADLEEYQPLHWKTDIETQVDHFNVFVQTTLQRQCPVDRHGPKKSYHFDHVATAGSEATSPKTDQAQQEEATIRTSG